MNRFLLNVFRVKDLWLLVLSLMTHCMSSGCTNRRGRIEASNYKWISRNSLSHQRFYFSKPFRHEWLYPPTASELAIQNRSQSIYRVQTWVQISLTVTHPELKCGKTFSGRKTVLQLRAINGRTYSESLWGVRCRWDLGQYWKMHGTNIKCFF